MLHDGADVPHVAYWAAQCLRLQLCGQEVQRVLREVLRDLRGVRAHRVQAAPQVQAGRSDGERSGYDEGDHQAKWV